MWESLAQMNSWLVYLLLFLFAFVAAYLLLLITGQTRKKGGVTPKKRSRLGCLSMLILVLVAFTLLSFLAYIRAYHAFTEKEVVAMIECRRAQQEDYDFQLLLVQIVDQVPQQTRTLSFRGDQWSVGGDILKWNSSLNVLGLHTMYRLTRVEGRFSDISEHLAQPASSYSLVGEQSRIWMLLYDFGDLLPFVESAYGSTVYTRALYGAKYLVYVTTSGYMVERVEGDTVKRSGELVRELMDFFRRN